MSDYYYAADPAFYDNSEWITCDTCEREYDRKEYNSDTCVECENELTIKKERGQVMETPTITQELEWCEIELANIKAGLFSMHTQEYIEGAISALKLAKEGK
jgi:methionyl-tRNA synthetase